MCSGGTRQTVLSLLAALALPVLAAGCNAILPYGSRDSSTDRSTRDGQRDAGLADRRGIPEGAHDGARPDVPRDGAAPDRRQDLAAADSAADRASADQTPSPDLQPPDKPPPAPDGGGVLAHQWSRRFGAQYPDSAYAAGVDAQGNVYVAGAFVGTVDFGGGPLISTANSSDIFLASYTPSGAHRFSRRVGSTWGDWAGAMAVDASGNSYLTGLFSETVDFGGGSVVSVGAGDVFLASYDADGKYRFALPLGKCQYNEEGRAIALAPSGDIWITGYFWGPSSFGGGSLTSAGGADIFVAGFSSSGAHLFSQRFGGANEDSGEAIAVDGLGNVHVVGYVNSAVDFGGGLRPHKGKADVFLLSLSSTGQHRFSHQLGGAADDKALAVAADALGDSYFTGFFSSSASFGGATFSAGQQDAFLASYGANGTHRFSKQMGGTQGDAGRAIALRPGGGGLLAGMYNAKATFEGVSLTSSGGDDIFLASFDGLGALGPVSSIGGAGTEVVWSVVPASGGAVYLAGNFTGTTNLAGQTHTSVGQTDAFLLKLGP
jgi:hypothetical protein